jgi:hypothetical protein
VLDAVYQRVDQIERNTRPEAQSSGVRGASNEAVQPAFNNTYKQALASRTLGNSYLPEITFVDGGNSLDYQATKTGPKSFALGVDCIDVRNGSLAQLGQKFDGIAEGLSSTLLQQLTVMAEDPNAVNKGFAQMGEAVKVAFDYYSDKVSRGDLNGFTRDLNEADAAIKQASDSYDKASPKQQGEVIGSVMTVFLPVPALAKETELANDASIASRSVKGSAELIDGIEQNGEKPPFLQFVENLGKAAKDLAAHEKQYMAEKGISIRGVDRISQIDADIPAGATGLCRTVDGQTQIFVSREVEPGEIPYVLRHEFGHAIDRTFFDGKRLSTIPGFEAAFQKDIAQLSTDERRILRRYCKDDFTGRRETFASLYALNMETPTTVARELLLKERFPNTNKWINGLVEALRNE